MRVLSFVCFHILVSIITYKIYPQPTWLFPVILLTADIAYAGLLPKGEK